MERMWLKILVVILVVLASSALGALLMHLYQNGSKTTYRVDPHERSRPCIAPPQPEDWTAEPFRIDPAAQGDYIREYKGKERHDDTKL